MGKQQIEDHFEHMAAEYDGWKHRNAYYHDTLKTFFGRHVGPDDRAIEFGCGTGDVIGSLNVARAVGLDVADEMVARGREKYPGITFERHDCETPYHEVGTFDVAVLADIIDHVTDILRLYTAVNRVLRIGGRMCISTVNPLWTPIFAVAERLGLKMPEGEHNFVPNRYLIGMLELRGFRLVERGALMLIPKRIPFVSDAVNRVAPRLPVLNRLCVAQTLVAEKVSDFADEPDTDMSCSVVIPCYNEAENIESCIARTPGMGSGTEIVVVDDGSGDGTAEVVRRVAEHDRRVRLVSYTPNRGKGYAVKQGFDAAHNDVIMILDADMTVMPEELPLFFRAVAEQGVGFANGTRMVYPMEAQAMKFLNFMGNFFFGVTLSWLLSQRVSDTLCGTKALRRADYAHIHMGGDAWGDFDLLFGAAQNRLRIVEIPVHYRARTGGVSKMQPFQHCLILLKVCLVWFVRLKLRLGRRRGGGGPTPRCG